MKNCVCVCECVNVFFYSKERVQRNLHYLFLPHNISAVCCLLCKNLEDKRKTLVFIRVWILNHQRSAIYKRLLETDILLLNVQRP